MDPLTLTPAELDAIRDAALPATHYATMVKYDHGGARIGVFEGDEHQLVADIYNEVDRNFFEVATPETVLRLVEQARQMEWQPIETAPKDGTEIIVSKNGKLFIVDWSTPNGWTTRNGNSITPDGWFPLPKPPEAK